MGNLVYTNLIHCSQGTHKSKSTFNYIPQHLPNHSQLNHIKPLYIYIYMYKDMNKKVPARHHSFELKRRPSSQHRRLPYKSSTRTSRPSPTHIKSKLKKSASKHSIHGSKSQDQTRYLPIHNLAPPKHPIPGILLHRQSTPKQENHRSSQSTIKIQKQRPKIQR